MDYKMYSHGTCFIFLLYGLTTEYQMSDVTY